MLFSISVPADQYKSEVRELENTPSAAPQVDPAKLLQQTSDPYARALLLRDLAAKAAQKEDYAGAARFLEQAINEKSLSGPALEQMRKDLTQLYVASGKPSEVIKALEPMVKNNPAATAEQQAALAGAYLENKRYADALPLLQKAVASKPQPDESWLQGLYAALVNTGREKESGPVLERLLRINPGRREYWMQLAGLELKSGQREKALGLLELASRQGFLQSADERLQVVSLTARAGAPFEAASLLQAWMDDGQIPKSVQNWEALAGLWVDARETALAVGALNQALEQQPKAELYLQLGQLHMQREEYQDAAINLGRGLSQSTPSAQRAPALLMLGAASYYAGNFDGAREAFRGAARAQATQKAAQEWLAWLDTEDAREASRLAAQHRAQRAEKQVALSQRLLGGRAVQVAPQQFASEAPEVAPVSPGDIRRISGRLTPVGAESDANADGTIPAWTGGLQKAQWPASYKEGALLADPYPQDKPQFTVTAANAAQYAAKLSTGHRALLARYPGFSMPVYATRRSAIYPQAIYDATQANVGKAKLIGSDALTQARLGFPFPQPRNGVEVMWNHRTRFRGNSFLGVSTQAVVGANGVSNDRKSVFRVLFRYGNVKDPANIDQENIIVYGINYVGERVNDKPEFVVLFHETANSIKKARGIWVLLNRLGGKMMRIPPVGYDQPLYGTEGLYFIDMIDMYNGAFDRYVWKLIGKRELVIPYNAYRLNDGSQKYAQQLTHPTFNAANARYELHRVWVIEATERGGSRHAFGKRIFYVDEDSWNVVLVENQDHDGRLWRFQEGHLVTSYDVMTTNSFPIVTYDLKQNRYYVHRLQSEDPPLKFDLDDINDQQFLPANVKSRYSK